MQLIAIINVMAASSALRRNTRTCANTRFRASATDITVFPAHGLLPFPYLFLRPMLAEAELFSHVTVWLYSRWCCEVL